MPEKVALKVLWEFHAAAGHIGKSRMLKEVNLRYVIPDSVPVQTWTQGIREGCKVCQAAEVPHWPREGMQEHFPIPERVMHSV